MSEIKEIAFEAVEKKAAKEKKKLKKKARKRIRRIIRTIFWTIFVLWVGIFIGIHRRVILAAIKGEEFPTPPASHWWLKGYIK